jgi:hypothetical protein
MQTPVVVVAVPQQTVLLSSRQRDFSCYCSHCTAVERQ